MPVDIVRRGYPAGAGGDVRDEVTAHERQRSFHSHSVY